MDRTTIAIDPGATKFRRVGRLARRRMRIEGSALGNGVHSDGTVTVEISGLDSPVPGSPESFEWKADRPIVLMVVRSGIDGEDVAFQVGPIRQGAGRAAAIGAGAGAGIRSIAFCYDAAPGPVVAGPPVTHAARATPAAADALPIAPAVAEASADRRGLAAARALAPTGRDRRSILASILRGSAPRRTTTEPG